MGNKDFKVKNKLQVAGITSAGPIMADVSGNLDSTSSIATQYGGTGTTTSPTSEQILYSASGTTYAPTNATSSLVGLGNVDNTTDAGKPVSSAGQTALNLKANLAGPTFTGVPAAPTASAGTNTTQVATTAFVLANVSSGFNSFLLIGA